MSAFLSTKIDWCGAGRTTVSLQGAVGKQVTRMSTQIANYYEIVSQLPRLLTETIDRMRTDGELIALLAFDEWLRSRE